MAWVAGDGGLPAHDMADLPGRAVARKELIFQPHPLDPQREALLAVAGDRAAQPLRPGAAAALTAIYPGAGNPFAPLTYLPEEEGLEPWPTGPGGG